MTGKSAVSAHEHGGPAGFVGLSADGTILATVAVDGLCRLWDVKTGTLAAEATYKQDRPALRRFSRWPDAVDDSESGLLQSNAAHARSSGSFGVAPQAGGAGPACDACHAGARAIRCPNPRLACCGLRRDAPGSSTSLLALDRQRFHSSLSPFPRMPPASGSLFPRPVCGCAALRGRDDRARDRAAPRAWIMGENGVTQTVTFAETIGHGATFSFSPSGKYRRAAVTAVGEARCWVFGICTRAASRKD